jgi:SAM-dependent methyltransferase
VSEPPHLFDGRAVRRQRDRAAATLGRVRPLLEETAERLLERLDDTSRRFSRALDIGGRGSVAPRLRQRGMQVVCCDVAPRIAAQAGRPAVVADPAWLPFAPGSFDLVVASLSLHWIDDLPGCLVQIRQVLRPDGLFLGSLPALGTLGELRTALATAEIALRRGAAPRVSPFPDLRDCAGLLQRAGFALPVADREELRLAYADPLALLRDLRHAGEANALRLRDRRPPPRAMFVEALAALPTDADGRSLATLTLAMLTGWAPDTSQPRPLRPGQFTQTLASALGGPQSSSNPASSNPALPKPALSNPALSNPALVQQGASWNPGHRDASHLN